MITSFPKMIRCHGDRCILQENVEDKYTRKTYLIIIIIIKKGIQESLSSNGYNKIINHNLDKN